jgi:hypothetical protein
MPNVSASPAPLKVRRAVSAFFNLKILLLLFNSGEEVILMSKNGLDEERE